MAARVVVIGSSNTDMVVKAARIPQPGETVLGGEFVMVPGGKGANQAVAAARLGAEVTLVARMGDDLFGEASMRNFRDMAERFERAGAWRRVADAAELGAAWRSWLDGPDTRGLETAEAFLLETGAFKREVVD